MIPISNNLARILSLRLDSAALDDPATGGAGHGEGAATLNEPGIAGHGKGAAGTASPCAGILDKGGATGVIGAGGGGGGT